MSAESPDDGILDLLARWSAARDAGQPLSVEELCQEQPELMEQVRDRVQALEKMQWLEQATLSSGPPPANLAGDNNARKSDAETISMSGPPGPAPRAGTTVRYIGDYELLAEIARGGMGVVYKARQVRLKRVVALKMILAGNFASPADVQRFHTEAESAAQLDHPNIVPVFEVGEHEGLHYFSMGYVEGASLAAQLNNGPLPPREAAELVRTVAKAVHYAHGKGVVHRDLKPGNILIDKNGQPRVTDFGLAKRMQSGGSDLTGTGQILGTPSYMPPEQAIGQPSLVHEAADIYALGAILYALLTGRPPFQADNPLDTLRQVLEREPVPPRQLNPAIPLDLETICLKCLEKSSARRYASAQDIADELTRFLEGKPILARPVGTLSRVWRWCKRNRVVASLLTAVFVSLVAGIALSSYFAIQAQESARATSAEAANLALNQAENLCEDGEANVGMLWMVRAHRLAIDAGDPDLADASRAMIAAWLPQTPRLEFAYSNGRSPAARFGKDDQTLLIAHQHDSGNSLKVLDAATGELSQSHSGIHRPCFDLPVSPDRTRCLVLDDHGDAKIWSIVEKRWLSDAILLQGKLFSADFSPNGKILATATEPGHVQFWNAFTGETLGTAFQEPQDPAFPACIVRFNRDSRTVWVTGTGRNLVQRQVSNGSLVQPKLNLNSAIYSLAVSHSRPLLALGHIDGKIEFFNFAEQPPRSVGGAPSQLDFDLKFFRDGSGLLAGGRGVRNGARFWDTARCQPLGAFLATPTTVTSVQLAANDRRGLICTVRDVEMWRRPAMLDHSPAPLELDASAGLATYCAKKSLLITGAERDGMWITLRKIDGTGGLAQIGPLPHPLVFLKADSSGRLAVGVTAEHELILADLERETFRLGNGKAAGIPDNLIFAANGRTACFVTRVKLFHDGTPDNSMDKTRTVQAWDLEHCTPIALDLRPGNWRPRSIDFNSAGDTLAVAESKEGLQLFAVSGGKQISPPLPLGTGNISCIKLHPDGRRIVLTRGKSVEVWDLAKRQCLHVLGKHDSGIGRLELSRDGRYAISHADDRTVRIWDVDAGRIQGTPIRNTGSATDISLGADNQLLAVHSREMQTRIFHVRTGRLVSPRLELAYTHNTTCQIEVSDDGKSVFIASQMDKSRPGFYHLADVPSQHEVIKLLVETCTGLALDGQDVRILPRDEWKKRQDALAATGWKETAQPSKTATEETEIPKEPEFKEPIIIEAGSQDLRGIVYSGDGTRLAVCSSKQTKVWEAATQKLVQEFPGLNSGSLAICLSGDGKLLLSGGGFGLKWWNVDTGALERTRKFESNVVDIAFSLDEQLVAVAQQSNSSIQVLRRDTGEVVQTLDVPISQPTKESRADSTVSFSPDGKSLIASAGGKGWPDYVGENSAIAVWDVDSWKLRASFTADKYNLVSLAISPDSQWIAAACHGGRTVNLWRVPESPQTISATASLARVIESKYAQNAVAYSPDGRLLAHSSHAAELGTVVLEKLDSKATVVLPTVDGAWGLAFSPNGKQLAACSRNGTVSLWDVEDLTDPAKSKEQTNDSIRPLHESEVARLLTQDKIIVEREVAKLLAQGKAAVEQQHGEMKALPVLQRARQLQQYLVTKDSADPAAQAILGEIYERMGRDRYNTQPRPAAAHAAMADIQHAVDALEIAVRHKDAKAEWAACLIDADALTILASGDINREARTLQRIADLQTRFGDDLAIQTAKGKLLARLAQVTMNSDHAAAIRRFDDANSILLKVFAANGDPQAINVVARGTSNQSNMVMGRPFDDPERVRIREAASRVVPLIDQVHREHKDVPAYAVALAALLTNQGQYDYFDGDMASAAPLFERAGDIFRERIERKQNVQGLASRKNQNCKDAAYCFSRFSDDEAAWRKAIEISEYVISDYQSLKRDAPYPEVYNALAVAKLRLGDLAAAKAAMDKTFTIHKMPDADDLFWRAAILYKLGEKEKADEDWQAAEDWVKANPTVAPLVMTLNQRLAAKYRPAAQ